MQKSFIFLSISPSIFLAIFFVACGMQSNTQAVSDYDKLCKIYEEVISDKISQTKIVTLLTERIKKEIPVL